MKWTMAILLLMAAWPANGSSQSSISAKAKALHERLVTLDTHLDTPASLPLPGWDIGEEHDVHADYTQVDVPRLKKGGLDGGFWVIYTPQGPLDPENYRRVRDFAVLRGLAVREMIAADPANFVLATRPEDAARIAAEGKRIVYLSVENAYPLGEDVGMATLFHGMGVRMMGFAHFRHNQFADSATDPGGKPMWNGLSPLGKELLAEMNRLGIIPDLSHSSDAAFDQALALSTTPLILSHSGCKAIYNHPRNIDDDRLRALAAKGGVIQMNAYGGYLRAVKSDPDRDAALKALGEEEKAIRTPAEREAWLVKRRAVDGRHPPADRATFDDFMAHLLHALKLIGPDHVGIGLDWDGGGGVLGMEDVSAVPKITGALLKAGYAESDIAKIWSGNVLRVLAAAEAAKQEGE